MPSYETFNVSILMVISALFINFWCNYDRNANKMSTFIIIICTHNNFNNLLQSYCVVVSSADSGMSGLTNQSWLGIQEGGP